VVGTSFWFWGRCAGVWGGGVGWGGVGWGGVGWGVWVLMRWVWVFFWVVVF